MITLVHAEAGDWVAAYRDGVLLEQGHSLDPSYLLDALGVEHEVIWDAPCEGRFPDRWPA